MATFDELTLNRFSERDVRAASLPPLPVEGDIDVGVAQGFEYHNKSFVRQAAGVFKQVGKALTLPFSFTLKGLERTDYLFRTTVLTAMGRVPREEYFRYAKEIISGDRRVTGAAFLEIGFGLDLAESFGDTNAIPGWTKEVINPFTGVAEDKPRVSLGGIAEFAVEALISPFALPALMPAKFVQATKIGKAMDIMTYPVSKPLQLAADAVLSPDHGLGAFLFRLADPAKSMSNFTRVAGEGADGFTMLSQNGKAMRDLNIEVTASVRALAKKHGMSQSFFARLRGKTNPDIDNAKVFRHMFYDNQKLNAAEQAFIDDLHPILRKFKTMLADAESDTIRNTTGRPIQATPVKNLPKGHKIDPRAKRTKVTQGPDGQKIEAGVEVFDPDAYLLRQFIPTPKNYIREAGRMVPQGDKLLRERVNYQMPWKEGPQGDFPFKLDFAENNMDPLHALEFWMGSAGKRSILHNPTTGVLHKNNFGITANFGEAAQNPNLAKLADHEFSYWMDKVHQLTGNRQRKWEVVFDRKMDIFHKNVTDFLRGTHRGNRVIEFFSARVGSSGGRFAVEKIPGLSDPTAWRAHRITSALVANQMISLLGLNLASALKNTSQFLNEATISGLPTAMKGLFNMAPLTQQGKNLRRLRKIARMDQGFQELATDPSIWGGGRSMLDYTMHAFNTMETTMRGLSFNVYAGEALEKLGIKTLTQLENLAPKVLDDIVQKGVRHADEVNHLYGVAGRSGFMMTPPLQMAMALQSYSWKQMEFVNKVMRSQGGNFMRYLSLQGWTMRTLDALGGINSENWLGWGFLPPKGVFGQGPAVELAKDTVGLLYARAEGNDKEFQARMDKLRGGMRDLFSSFGADPDNPVSAATQVVLGAGATLGAIPIPVVAIGKLNKTVDEVLTGQSESAGGRTWRPITPQEAITSHFFRLHEATEGVRLQQATRRARLEFDGAMRKRVGKLFDALEGTDGDKVLEAARELAQPVSFKVPITTEFIQGLWVGDEKTMHPTNSMITSRIRNEAQRRAVSGPVREMLESGWVGEILVAMYMERVLRDVELGATRKITGGAR